MKNKCISCALGIMICIVCISIRAQESNWPQFRGVNCSGLAGADQHPPSHLDKAKNMLWSTSLNTGQSSPCIWGELIFITGSDESSKTLNMYAIKRETGALEWKRDLKVDSLEQVHRVSHQANATPVTDGERVVFYFGSYGLLCLDYEGNVLWDYPMSVPETVHGMGTSPVIAGDLVLLNCLGQINDPCLLAINKIDGSLVWKYTSDIREGEWVDSYSTPVIHNHRAIIYRSRDVAAYDLDSGKQIWTYPARLGDAVCTPVIGDDLLFVTFFSTLGNPSAIEQFPDFHQLCELYDSNEDRKLAKEEIAGFTWLNYPEKSDIADTLNMGDWFSFWDQNRDEWIDSAEYEGINQYCQSFYEKQGIKAIRLGGSGEIGMDHFAWGNPDHVPHVTSPLYLDGRVYEIKSGGILSCFKANDGRLLFRERIGAAGTYFASPVAAGDRIYFAARNGVITVVEAGDSMVVVSRTDLGEIISATPAIVDNKIYIRTEESLYAFGE
jgi:outer membrane protein assembly factor BamB